LKKSFRILNIRPEILSDLNEVFVLDKDFLGEYFTQPNVKFEHEKIEKEFLKLYKSAG
jgi:hypothetical protein